MKKKNKRNIFYIASIYRFSMQYECIMQPKVSESPESLSRLFSYSLSLVSVFKLNWNKQRLYHIVYIQEASHQNLYSRQCKFVHVHEDKYNLWMFYHTVCIHRALLQYKCFYVHKVHRNK